MATVDYRYAHGRGGARVGGGPDRGAARGPVRRAGVLAGVAGVARSHGRVAFRELDPYAPAPEGARLRVKAVEGLSDAEGRS